MLLASVHTSAGGHINWMEASLEQLSAPLPPWAIRAGARETIYHDPRNTTAAIVTCGGLCPGLNDVVAVSGTAGGHQQGVTSMGSQAWGHKHGARVVA